jgi:serine/threonine-protein kinase
VNAAVPQLLNFIVAKMLAKPLEERYQSAQELAQDLRNCERQISAPTAITQPLRPLGLASGPQPELAVTQAQAVVMAQTLNRTRQQDSGPGEASVPPPARGLAHSFDSAEATQRLATLTGAATMSESVSATQAISSMKPPEKRGWRRRDWLLVGGATVLGALLAGAIIRRR